MVRPPYPPAAEIRPRRLWFLIAALIVVAGLATAAVIFVRLIVGAGPTRTFGPGETVTLHLGKAPRPGFYVTDAGSPNDRCYARDSTGRQFTAEPISGTATITENGTRWHVPCPTCACPPTARTRSPACGPRPTATRGTASAPRPERDRWSAASSP
ncbi:hypothetical protein GCM10023191_046790 [Actinoallomurus oryzae]|uniref:Uncharacterized protein n=1 Tax=Actinoallomurus oryzae TaxID=502180 RepID=A0ABP8Q9Q0_9ACTN